MILASNSPRRKEILLKAGYDFKIVPSNYDEKISNLAYNQNLVENCALQKALEVQKRLKTSDLIISSDTVVVLNNKILGKPKDEKEAFLMLSNLSGNNHFVATSICLVKENKILKDTQKTFVTFRKLEDEEIINYIKTKHPLDKAGSYGIQDENFDFNINLDGELDNVIGFPLKLFKKLLSLI